jgi:hypothetical protein
MLATAVEVERRRQQRGGAGEWGARDGHALMPSVRSVRNGRAARHIARVMSECEAGSVQFSSVE